MPKPTLVLYIQKYIPNTWALATALPYGRVGICEILFAADKALVQRLFFSMSAKRIITPLAWQRNEKILEWRRNYEKNVIYPNTHLLE